LKNITCSAPHLCEIDYFRNIFNYLGSKLDDTYSFYFYNQGIYDDPEELEKIKGIENTTKKIAIHSSNELCEKFDDTFYDKFDLIFRFYQNEKCDNKKIFNISIGYNSSGDNVINFDNSKLLSDRTIDLFFAGKLGGRSDFNKSLHQLKNKNYLLKITPAFRATSSSGGFDIHEYYKILSDTKICLVPNGFSPETFRYSEALGSGCIVITNVKLDSWFYKNNPTYYVDDWSKVDNEYVQKILKSDINKKQKENIKYYEKYLSPKDNAQYILDIIKRKYL